MADSMAAVPRTERIVLEVVSGVEPITGELLVPGRAPARFEGYVQLIGALQTLRSRSSEDATSTTPSGEESA